MKRYELRAINDAPDSENRIHEDAFAKRYGFRGGLVPGVTVFAYLVRAALDAHGREWLSGGQIAARFLSPVYDGEDVVVAADGSGERLGLSVLGPDGSERVVGHSSTQRSARAGFERLPHRPLPDPAPPASREALEACREGLGSLSIVFEAAKAERFLTDVSETSEVFRSEGIAHPGFLLRAANWILMRNIVLGPWIHVESELDLLREVRDGEEVSIRARVTDLFEKKGHQLVSLDVQWLANDEPAARARHVAIYELRA